MTTEEVLKDYLKRDVEALDLHDAWFDANKNDVGAERLEALANHRRYLAVRVMLSARALTDVWRTP